MDKQEMKMLKIISIQIHHEVVTYLLLIFGLPRIQTSCKANNQTNYISNCKGNSNCISLMF